MRPTDAFIAAVGGLLLGVVSHSGPARAFEMPEWTTAHYRDAPLVGTIWTGDGRMRGMADLVAAVRGADFVVAGETHDNPDHHRIQAGILGDMVAVGETPALVFEMIATDKAPALEAYLDHPDRTAGGLGPAVDWTSRGWPDWAEYQPIAEVALAAHLTVRAGDLPRGTIARIGREGEAALSMEDAMRYGLDRPLDTEFGDQLKIVLEQSHCGMLPKTALDAMVVVQRARDGSLAAETLRAADETGGRALLVTGAGHARTDWAVPALIKARQPAANVVSIGLLEVEAGQADPAASGVSSETPAPYDFVLFTPKADISDPCEGMAEQMKAAPAK